MNWYYTILGGHVHVRVFMNHGKCGDLVFRYDEFVQVRENLNMVTFYNEGHGTIEGHESDRGDLEHG